MLAVGANGAGKTNLLESLHVGTQGFSPRTRSDAELIRFGERCRAHPARGVAGSDARPDQRRPVHDRGEEGGAERSPPALGGAAARARRRRSSSRPTGWRSSRAGPAARRAYFDRSLWRGCCLPEHRCPATTARRLAQRNAALRRVAPTVVARCARPGPSRSRGSARSWSQRARRRSSFSTAALRERAGELGLDRRRLGYEGDPPTTEALEARLDRDLERGVDRARPAPATTSRSPPARRDLRSFGSQGEQRTGRARAPARRGRAARRAPRRAAAAPPRRRPLRARSRAAPRRWSSSSPAAARR